MPPCFPCLGGMAQRPGVSVTCHLSPRGFLRAHLWLGGSLRGEACFAHRISEPPNSTQAQERGWGGGRSLKRAPGSGESAAEWEGWSVAKELGPVA